MHIYMDFNRNNFFLYFLSRLWNLIYDFFLLLQILISVKIYLFLQADNTCISLSSFRCIVLFSTFELFIHKLDRVAPLITEPPTTSFTSLSKINENKK